MEKRIFAAIVISVAFLWIWAAVAPRLFPELAKPAPVVTSTAAKTTTARSTTTGTTVPPASSPHMTTTAVTPPMLNAGRVFTPVAGTSVMTTVVDRPDYIATFTNRGAQLISFRLKRYTMKTGELVELVKTRPRTRTDFPFAIEAQNGALANELNTALYAVNVDRGSDERTIRSIEFTYASTAVSVKKTFRFEGEYLVGFSASINPPVPYRVAMGPGLRQLAPEEHESKIVVTGNGVVQRSGSFALLDKNKGDRIKIYDQVDYVGVEDNYFLAVFRPTRAGAAVLRRIDLHAGKELKHELYVGINAAGDGTVAGTAFLGPKQAKLLDGYGLASVLQFGTFGIIARFLLDVLVWINQFTHNYGWAIIVLTILIKIVLYPLQHKGIVSMKKMQKLSPKMDAIKKRYKNARTDPDQRTKMNTEMMKLYQVEGINPMSGCLPMVLQLPILWGFYGLLSRAIELRGAPFMLWIHDLSDKDPYYVTPLLMTITMFIQTYITPTTGDPAQRRIFLIMPLVFGFIFKDMPSGLVLYWLVQNILTIVQQTIMNKWWKDHPTELQNS